jgi:hypothetical protein
MKLEPEAELRTAEGSSAQIALPSGAVVAVEASTRVRLPADARSTLAERLDLAEGRLSLRVPKLAGGHSLSVVTPDSTVTVRGTRFSVAVSASPTGSMTSVVVDEGRVEVRSAGRSAWLGAGDTWSSRPAAPSVASASAASEALGAPEHGRLSSAAEAAGRSAPKAALPPGEQSSLAEENRLLEQALRKARTGSIADALADLERFQREHPRSPLTQAVRVEHFRLLREAGQTERAAREARRYLSDYPNGFARDDAKQTALYGVEGTP